MWFREFKDYKIDQAMVQYPVEPGHGIIGCEMHEVNGWGNTLHFSRKRKKHGFLAEILMYFFHK